MDHSAAQATFVEVAFAINTVFAVYKSLRDSLQAQLAKTILEHTARALSIEEKKNDLTHLNVIKKYLEERSQKHIAFQDQCLRIATKASLIMASLCILILWFNLLEALGRWTGLLMMPLLVYFAVTKINGWVFMAAGDRKLGKFKTLMKYSAEFEGRDY